MAISYGFESYNGYTFYTGINYTGGNNMSNGGSNGGGTNIDVQQIEQVKIQQIQGAQKTPYAATIGFIGGDPYGKYDSGVGVGLAVGGEQNIQRSVSPSGGVAGKLFSTYA